MPETSAVAILPCNDLDASEAFWNRLGFARDPDAAVYEGYRILGNGSGAFVHLNEAVEGWVVPGRNPFGVYVYAQDVDELATRVRDDIIEHEKAPTHKEWGMYEFSLSDPDGVLVRVGWSSQDLPPSSHRD